MAISLAVVHASTATTLPDQLAEIVKRAPGHIGAAAMSLESGETAAVRGADHFPMQSVYKLPISMAVLARVDRGELKLDQKVLVTKDDLVPESMNSRLRDEHPDANVECTVTELINRTMVESDGTTSDVLMRLVGGADAVAEYLRGLKVEGVLIATTEKEIGLDHSVQYRNWGTPDGYLQLLRALHDGRAIHDDSRAFLLDLMIRSKPGPRRLKGMLPADAVVAHKTGTSGTEAGITAATNDVGIMTLPNGRHVAVAVFVSDSPADADAREGVIAQLGRAAWDYWSSKRD